MPTPLKAPELNTAAPLTTQTVERIFERLFQLIEGIDDDGICLGADACGTCNRAGCVTDTPRYSRRGFGEVCFLRKGCERQSGQRQNQRKDNRKCSFMDAPYIVQSAECRVIVIMKYEK